MRDKTTTFLTSLLLSLALTASCTSQKSATNGSPESATASQAGPSDAIDAVDSPEPTHGEAVSPQSAEYDDGLAKALFAGGCFWCLEPPFDEVEGVVATVSGYAGGAQPDPKYKQVAGGKTSHTEAVLVLYEPAKVTYAELLEVFWRTHDPTDAGGQFVDRGSQYRPAVFVYDDAQRSAAKESKAKLEGSGKFDEPIATEIVDATEFWPAEEYHQDFYKKDPSHYKRYRRGSGRDQFLERVWNE